MIGRGCFLALIVLANSRALEAQTDYYNTDGGRPVRVEDAAPVEHHAFELQLAPVRVEREGGGAYHWEIEPELAYGILPRTHIEVGFPFIFMDVAGEPGESGLGGIHLSAMHNLNVETRTFPAFALAGDLALPVGSLAPEKVHAAIKGIATRTFSFGRVHANGSFSLGSLSESDDRMGETSQWMVGAAYDRAFPLRSLLATVDLFAERPSGGGRDLEWTAEGGVRYQTSPQFNLDIGIGRRFAGDERAWMFTFGLAHAFAVRSLMEIR